MSRAFNILYAAMAVFYTEFSQALADEAVAAAPQPTMVERLIPIVVIFVLMYFILIRPQVKKAKEHQSLVDGLKAGDEVVTSGGIIGRVKSVADGFVALDCGSTTLKVLKANVNQLTGKSQKAPAAKS